VRQFLGLTNYFRKFIQAYAAKALPMQALTLKGTVFAWQKPQQQAFDELKEALTSAPVLALPNFTQPFEVISHASLLGTGALLMQNGRPIAYTSKSLSSAERNYHTTDQEMRGTRTL
jgi:hypothetical protein